MSRRSPYSLYESPPQRFPAVCRYRLERFARLGLKWNPFRVAEPAEICGFYTPPSDDAASATEIAGSDVPVTQILAPCGWGKSTLLLAVAKRLREIPRDFWFTYIPQEGPFDVGVPSDGISVFLIDEAQRVARRNLRELFHWLEKQRSRRLIVTSHADLSAETSLETATIRIPRVDPQRLERLFQRRIDWAQSGEAAPFRLEAAAAEWLIDRCRSNLRLVEASLYEVFQQMTPSGPYAIDRPQLDAIAKTVDSLVAEAERQERLHR